MLIGLAGYAGSGKDTVGKILVEEHGFKRLAFADKVKELALKIDPIIWRDVPMFGSQPVALSHYLTECGGWEEAKKNECVRRDLQNIGQGVRDVLGEYSWIDAALWEIDTRENIVITDVRYPNELRVIANLGGVSWWVSRPGVGPVNSHASENSVDEYDCDFTIENLSNLEYLRNRIKVNLGRSELRQALKSE